MPNADQEYRPRDLVTVYTSFKGEQYRLRAKQGKWYICKKDGRGWSVHQPIEGGQTAAEKAMRVFARENGLYEDTMPERFV